MTAIFQMIGWSCTPQFAQLGQKLLCAARHFENFSIVYLGDSWILLEWICGSNFLAYYCKWCRVQCEFGSGSYGSAMQPDLQNNSDHSSNPFQEWSRGCGRRRARSCRACLRHQWWSRPTLCPRSSRPSRSSSRTRLVGGKSIQLMSLLCRHQL